MHSTPLRKVPLLIMHIRRRDITAFRRLQLLPKEICDPDQNTVGPAEAFNNLEHMS
jgi:hypothetical protein